MNAQGTVLNTFANQQELFLKKGLQKFAIQCLTNNDLKLKI